MDITDNTPEAISVPKNSFVLVHQNSRGIINKTEELHEFISIKKLYPYVLCFSEHHLSGKDVHFVGTDNYALGSCFSRSTFQKGGVCIYVRNDVAFNCLDLSKYCKEKILEICAVQIENIGKRMVVICLYTSLSGDFKQFLKLLDLAFLSLNNPYMEVLICGDFNVDYLCNCTHKRELSILLGTYNMTHTLDFPTRLQNGHSSAIDTVFLGL